MNYYELEEMNIPEWDLLSSVKKPSRYTGSDWIPTGKPSGSKLDICLAFPDVYEIGMSYVGFQILYYFLKEILSVNVDRAYCPWIDMEQRMRKKGLGLNSLEFNRSLASFDVVGFTLQHELTYTNILTMLDLGGIPIRSSERSDDDPLVIAGGPGALVPEPVADFIDVFCLGDGEAFLPDFVKCLEKMKGAERNEKLQALSNIKGAYVPSLYSPEYTEQGVVLSGGGPALPVSRVIVESLDDTPFPDRMIVPNVPVIHDRIPVEIFRGCTRGCRFCQAGMIYRPVRERSPETVTNLMEKLLENTGWDEVSLVSLASCDHRGITDILDKSENILKKHRAKLSLPSLRMDSFSVDLATRLESMKRGSITFAPEAGTQRLRNIINKGVSEEDIESTADSVFRNGWHKMKLYFMMGLPGETDEDIEGIARISKKVLAIGRHHTGKTQLSVSVAGFVPKAHTPFQWEPQDKLQVFREKGNRIKSLINHRRISVHYHDPEQSFLEGVLARGDRRICSVMEKAWRKGARFDGWAETFSLAIWESAFEEEGLDPGMYANRSRSLDEKLPWDHIDAGVSRAFLEREREKALSTSLTQDCRWNSCQMCGQEEVCKIIDRGVTK